jgi:hypothetical protein
MIYSVKAGKFFLLVVLCLLGFFVTAQYTDDVKHCIFFRKPGDYHLRKVSEGEFCVIATKPKNKEFQGHVQRISHDSIFISDTVLKIKGITYIRFDNELKSPILLSQPSDMPERYILFEKDTIVWKVQVPPAKIFSSNWRYHNYIDHYQDSVKRSQHYRKQGPGFP